ncbi:MAG: MBL fold metallo-hydrolase, partial [Solirubrobacteraceae bacterium]
MIRIEAPLPIPDPVLVNCYLLWTGSEHVLVDTGMHGSEVAIDAALRDFDVQLDRVLVTHGHPDHWGIAGRYCATALAHPDVQSQLDFPQRQQLAVGAQGLPPGREIDDALFEDLMVYNKDVDAPPRIEPIGEGDRLGEWEVIVTPGHAPGHICLYRARDGVLIAGDHLLPLITPNIHLTTEMPDAVADYLSSLRRVAELDVSLVLPGHGEPF